MEPAAHAIEPPPPSSTSTPLGRLILVVATLAPLALLALLTVSGTALVRRHRKPPSVDRLDTGWTTYPALREEIRAYDVDELPRRDYDDPERDPKKRSPVDVAHLLAGPLLALSSA